MSSPILTGPLDPEGAEVLDLLTLAALPGLGDRRVASIVSRFGTAGRALAAPDQMFGPLAGQPATDARTRTEHRTRARETLERARAAGLGVTAISQPDYPARLRELHDPPPVLFHVGDAALLDGPAVAIVGARRSTEGGRRAARGLGAAVARSGGVVVSGMALGIDGTAHEGALAVEGGTIAVLGSGADRPTPTSHTRLYRKIRERGLVVSEFLPGAPAHAHAFPRRNRVIAALSMAVVVVEAGARSGALITVDHALDLGRDVFAVPGALHNRQSRGTNALIRDGARILLSPEQLLEELGLARMTRREEPAQPAGLGASAGQLWRSLDVIPEHVDRVVRRSGLPPATALATLTELEADGWVVRHAGARVARVDSRRLPSVP